MAATLPPRPRPRPCPGDNTVSSLLFRSRKKARCPSSPLPVSCAVKACAPAEAASAAAFPRAVLRVNFNRNIISLSDGDRIFATRVLRPQLGGTFHEERRDTVHLP